MRNALKVPLGVSRDGAALEEADRPRQGQIAGAVEHRAENVQNRAVAVVEQLDGELGDLGVRSEGLEGKGHDEQDSRRQSHLGLAVADPGLVAELLFSVHPAANGRGRRL